jgi:hypothetical protein
MTLETLLSVIGLVLAILTIVVGVVIWAISASRDIGEIKRSLSTLENTVQEIRDYARDIRESRNRADMERERSSRATARQQAPSGVVPDEARRILDLE